MLRHSFLSFSFSSIFVSDIMPNQKPFQRRLPSLLASFSFCVCVFACTSLPAQLFPRQTTRRAVRQTYPAPVYRPPSQGTVIPSQGTIIPPQGTIIYPPQGTVYPPQGTPVYPQQIPGPGSGQNIVPNQQGTIFPAPSAQQQTQPVPPGQQQVQPPASGTDYNALVKQNQELKKRVAEDAKKLNQLNLSNDRLEQRVQEVDNALNTATNEFNEAKIEIVELRKNLEASDSAKPDMSGLNATLQQRQNELNEISARYEQAFKQNETLANQVKSLTKENSGFRSELDRLRLNGGADMKNLQAELTGKSNRLNELEQEYGAIKAESERLQGLAETVNTENVRLTQQIENLSSSHEQLEAQLHSNLSAAKSVSTPAKMTNENMTSKFVSSQRSELTAENRHLLALNEETETENELLSQRIVDLEGTIDELSIKNKGAEASASATVASVSGLGELDSGESKFSIMYWLIPFLGIGLATALYVFLTEEYEGTSLTDSKRFNEPS